MSVSTIFNIYTPNVQSFRVICYATSAPRNNKIIMYAIFFPIYIFPPLFVVQSPHPASFGSLPIPDTPGWQVCVVTWHSDIV